jgi:signal transduction histidine kinase
LDTNSAESLIGESLSSVSVISAIDTLLHELAAVSGLDGIAYYIVDHSKAGFRLVASSNSERIRSVLPISARFPLDESTNQDVFREIGNDGTNIPVRDSTGLVGLLRSSQSLDESARRDLEPILSLAASSFVAFTREYTLLSLLESMQHPIPFNVGSDEFYQSIADLVAIASSMEFVAIRERDDGYLRCVGLSGFPQSLSKEEFDIRLQDVPIFHDSLASAEPRQCRSLHDASVDVVGTLTRQRALSDIESFVAVPLLVGGEVTGILSLASSFKAAYSSQQLTAFLSLANSIGVALSNFQLFHAQVQGMSELQEVGVAITALEVAQAVRHEAKASIGNLRTDLLTIRTTIQGSMKSDSKLSGVIQLLEHLDEDINAMNQILEKIQAATKPPALEWENTSIQDTWNSARDQVIGRLNKLKVRVIFDGPDQTIEAYPDWLRHVFLNLILNSADAFQFRGKRNAKHEIRLRYRRDASNEETVVYRYTDTAGGITPDQFASVPNPENKPLEQFIFDSDITTKDDGSGWGMFLVRQILGRHDGNIDVVSLRSGGGVVFDISLPRAGSL